MMTEAATKHSTSQQHNPAQKRHTAAAAARVPAGTRAGSKQIINTRLTTNIFLPSRSKLENLGTMELRVMISLFILRRHKRTRSIRRMMGGAENAEVQAASCLAAESEAGAEAAVWRRR
jgi:hypothetical protein